MTVLDLRGLMAALVERDIRFVIIGGVAVAAHGVLRLTEDVDVVPEPSQESSDRHTYRRTPISTRPPSTSTCSASRCASARLATFAQ